MCAYKKIAIILILFNWIHILSSLTVKLSLQKALI